MLSANPAIICIAVQLILAAVLVAGEVSGRLRLPYSKFGTGVGVDSRTGLGELLNGYHHWLLARLRPPGVRTYVVPRGGLFGWVASPHYFGEILSFVGYAMMSDLLPVWGNALVVFAYLSSRANSNLKWYQREMPLRIPI